MCAHAHGASCVSVLASFMSIAYWHLVEGRLCYSMNAREFLGQYRFKWTSPQSDIMRRYPFVLQESAKPNWRKLPQYQFGVIAHTVRGSTHCPQRNRFAITACAFYSLQSFSWPGLRMLSRTVLFAHANCRGARDSQCLARSIAGDALLDWRVGSHDSLSFLFLNHACWRVSACWHISACRVRRSCHAVAHSQNPLPLHDLL